MPRELQGPAHGANAKDAEEHALHRPKKDHGWDGPAAHTEVSWTAVLKIT
jgi:hypothetical protein